MLLGPTSFVTRSRRSRYWVQLR